MNPSLERPAPRLLNSVLLLTLSVLLGAAVLVLAGTAMSPDTQFVLFGPGDGLHTAVAPTFGLLVSALSALAVALLLSCAHRNGIRVRGAILEVGVGLALLLFAPWTLAPVALLEPAVLLLMFSRVVLLVSPSGRWPTVRTALPEADTLITT